MSSATIVFASTFLTVFALGLQSLNVNQGHYAAAAGTSILISTGHLWLYKILPTPTWWDLAGYYAGGICGIVFSMWFHRVVKAWWKSRKKRHDEHADVGQCGRIYGPKS